MYLTPFDFFLFTFLKAEPDTKDTWDYNPYTVL